MVCLDMDLAAGHALRTANIGDSVRSFGTNEQVSPALSDFDGTNRRCILSRGRSTVYNSIVKLRSSCKCKVTVRLPEKGRPARQCYEWGFLSQCTKFVFRRGRIKMYSGQDRFVLTVFVTAR